MKQSGPEITVMVDANCALSVEEAYAYLPALQSNDIFWFEEPIHSHDYRGHKVLRTRAQDYGGRIATGENGYGLHYFQTLIDYEGADVFNLDVAILPGYDPAIKVVEEAGCSREVNCATRGTRIANPCRCKPGQRFNVRILPALLLTPYGVKCSYRR